MNRKSAPIRMDVIMPAIGGFAIGLMLHIIVALVIGIACGIFTGLTPGVHINLVSLLLVSASPMLLQYTQPIALCVFIIAMAITHSYLDTIPSIFLGAPDSEDALNVLPGHRMLLDGKGRLAVRITIIGSYFALLLGILLSPLLIIVAPIILETLSPYIGWILVAVVLFMILKDKDSEKRLWNAIIFLLSGCFGVIVFSIPNLKDPLFPMLSGLFGVSGLILSLSESTKVPLQDDDDEGIEVPITKSARAVGCGVFAGSLTGIFPGLGAAQASILAMQIAGDIGDRGYMMLVGAIGSAASLFSLVTLYAIGKARDGAIIALSDLIGVLTAEELMALMAAALVTAGIATFITMKLSRVFSKLISRINYGLVCYCVIGFIIAMVLYMTSFLGLMVLATSTAIGLIAPLKGVGRNNAMGCLLLPVIGYFLL